MVAAGIVGVTANSARAACAYSSKLDPLPARW